MKYALISIPIVLVVVIVALLGYGISVANKETGLRNAIVAKQKDNQSEFDNMWKKIKQSAEVTDGQKLALLEIFKGHAEARSAGKQGGSLANWITESVPTVDTSTFKNLQNLIEASRDRWTMNQKQLIDLNREHDNILTMFPSSLVCSMLGRAKIDITIVTSERAEEAFKSGRDDDTSVFQKQQKVEATK